MTYEELTREVKEIKAEIEVEETKETLPKAVLANPYLAKPVPTVEEIHQSEVFYQEREQMEKYYSSDDPSDWRIISLLSLVLLLLLMMMILG